MPGSLPRFILAYKKKLIKAFSNILPHQTLVLSYTITEVFELNQFLTFAFIGGDSRQIQVISRFARDGHPIQTYGLDTAIFPKDIHVSQSPSLKDCLTNADIVVLPLPYTTGDEIIKTTFSSTRIYINDILRQLSGTQLLFAGRADQQLRTLSDLYNVHLIDYADREELSIRNSIPTVEGAVEIAMSETPYTIHGSRCLVLGYGRIGKLLSKTLKALGANTTVAARKHSDLAWIAANGLTGIPFASLSQHIRNFDLIFNTVPTMVLDFRLLSEVPDSGLIIDLSSQPGGVDFETARMLGKKVIWALSLPGKVAPETAGDIIKDTIANILEELGV